MVCGREGVWRCKRLAIEWVDCNGWVNERVSERERDKYIDG